MKKFFYTIAILNIINFFGILCALTYTSWQPHNGLACYILCCVNLLVALFILLFFWKAEGEGNYE